MPESGDPRHPSSLKPQKKPVGNPPLFPPPPFREFMLNRKQRPVCSAAKPSPWESSQIETLSGQELQDLVVLMALGSPRICRSRKKESYKPCDDKNGPSRAVMSTEGGEHPPAVGVDRAINPPSV
jgi:hypothetical protein